MRYILAPLLPNLSDFDIDLSGSLRSNVLLGSRYMVSYHCLLEIYGQSWLIYNIIDLHFFIVKSFGLVYTTRCK